MIVVGPSSSCSWQAPIVSVKFLSAVQAVICWKRVCSNAVPDQWMITLSHDVHFYTVHFYTLDGRTSKQKLPINLAPRTNYTVTVTPLFNASSFGIPGYWMLNESAATFTTPAAAG